MTRPPRRRTVAAVERLGLLLIVGAWAFAAFAPGLPVTLARFTDERASTGTWGTDTLAPPTGLAATGGSSVTLTWTPTVDGYAAGYDIRRSAVSGGPYTTVSSATPRTTTSTVDLPGPGTWFYVLRSTYQSWTSVNSGQASATVASSTTTPYAACTTTAADTTGAGDNNGYQTNPTRACVDDASAAQDPSSGNGGSQSCGTGSTPDVAKDRHRFWGFVTGLPGTVTSVDGIEVRVDLGMNNNSGTTNICAQLSWDAGATWTTIKFLPVSGTAEATYTFGGAADTWGRTWTAGQLATSSFRVRLIDASSQNTKQFELDYVAVRVTYRR
ncbi:MAG: hypothetical protein ABIQ58_01535 [Candidatus Limnocylindrales bacterium]